MRPDAIKYYAKLFQMFIVSSLGINWLAEETSVASAASK